LRLGTHIKNKAVDMPPDENSDQPEKPPRARRTPARRRRTRKQSSGNQTCFHGVSSTASVQFRGHLAVEMLESVELLESKACKLDHARNLPKSVGEPLSSERPMFGDLRLRGGIRQRRIDRSVEHVDEVGGAAAY
jgi:hypothetical protein